MKIKKNGFIKNINSKKVDVKFNVKKRDILSQMIHNDSRL